MAEKNFFDLLKEKMAALRPSERHRDDDWAALGDRLNVALPEQPRKRRRALLLPLFLLAALLSGGAVWWQMHQRDRAMLQRLEAQVAGLQASVAALEAAPPVVRTDTVWRMVYVQVETPRRERLEGAEAVTGQTRIQRDDVWGVGKTPNLLNTEGKPPRLLNTEARRHGGLDDGGSADSSVTFAAKQIAGQANIAPTALDSATRMADLPFLKTPGLALLKLPNPTISPIKNLVAQPLEEKKPTEPVGQNLLDALRPKYFKVGADIGWLYPKSSGLTREGGFSYSVEGVVGLSRHWCLTGAYSAGQLRYKTQDPAAILGVPALPPPHHGFILTEIEVAGQKTRQFDLGLRYTFAHPGQLRPFLGLGWGGLTVLPYAVEYETQHEHTGTIQKGVFFVSERTRLRNVLRFGAGLEIPLSPRFDLTLEGFYLRQWKKPSGIAPDLMGIRGGVHWLF